MRNKTIYSFSIVVLLIALFVSSCTKVIDVDTNSKDPKYVIEGFVTLGETSHRISITKTLNLDESIDFPTIDNATVLLSDDLGNSQNMTLIAPGLYEATGYPVAEGRTYSVMVTIDAEVFSASGIMPQAVILDTIETFPFAFGPTVINTLVPIRLDPAGIENQYQFKISEQGVYIPGIFIQSDQFNDGNLSMEPIFADGIDIGDTIEVEMYGIERTIYDFFFTLLQNDQGATPANPTSNFSGGCLGYFSVRTKSVKQIIIPG